MIKEELKEFNINIDDIEPNEITHGAMQELIEKIILEENVKRFEIVLNKNILNIKDRLTGIHSYMGLKLLLEPLEKDISFIIRLTDKLTYDELQQENKQLKDNWNKLKEYIKQEPTLYFYNDKLPFEVIIAKIINKMQELEQGSDSNE